jgi:2Fe-2S ferredoxin
MPEIFVTSRNGATSSLSVRAGGTLMEALRDGGHDELLALCGGCCSCATCHVYIDPDLTNQLLPLTSDEDELLESSSHRQPNSRLSCQIKLTDQLSALRATIAPED